MTRRKIGDEDAGLLREGEDIQTGHRVVTGGVRAYVGKEVPSENPSLHRLLLKLDGYGADQERRVVLLTDQDNRTYALAVLANHLDFIHLLDLLGALHRQLFFKFGEIGEKYYDNFEWPWQWGPQPQRAFPALPQVIPHPTQNSLSVLKQETDVWPRVREIMVKHEIRELFDDLSLRCACGKLFDQTNDSADAEELYNKHIRARVKEAVVGNQSSNAS